jgi:hypothetical protein
VRDKEIDEILEKAAASAGRPEPELLQRIADSILPALRPVRPLGSARLMASELVVACAAVSLAGGLWSGVFGFAKMNPAERALIFPVLGILLWVAARGLVAEIVPGSRRRVSPGMLLLLCCAGMAALFSLLFHDPSMDHFVPVGLGCLETGLLCAVPAALLSWAVVRRGAAMSLPAAGLVAGTLGGLAGVGMLELHCPNFEMAHLLVWHIAVVPLAGALGALVGWIAQARSRA